MFHSGRLTIVHLPLITTGCDKSQCHQWLGCLPCLPYGCPPAPEGGRTDDEIAAGRPHLPLLLLPSFPVFLFVLLLFLLGFLAFLFYDRYILFLRGLGSLGISMFLDGQFLAVS